jgi:hypothetical protein
MNRFRARTSGRNGFRDRVRVRVRARFRFRVRVRVIG